jgi:hypothetical protein
MNRVLLTRNEYRWNRVVELQHWYHAYCVGNWADIVNEHCDALNRTPFTTVHLGLVGPSDARHWAKQLFHSRGFSVVVVAEEPEGWEQVCLNALWAAAQNDATGDYVWYGHTKGVTEPAPNWRKLMTDKVFIGWETCLDQLQEHEAVGCHWLTPEAFPTVIRTPFFGGNFWAARSSLLKRLKPPLMGDRMAAEGWIGQNGPVDVFDLHVGWPSR